MMTTFPQLLSCCLSLPASQGVGQTLAIFGLPGGGEWIIILIIGLLLFGRRLPEVGRSLGRGIVEFKKGVKGIEDEVEDASKDEAPRRKDLPDTAARSNLTQGPPEAATERRERVVSAPSED